MSVWKRVAIVLMRFSASLALVLVIGGCSTALPPGAAEPDTPLAKKAYELLLDADRFESERVGAAGMESPYFIAWRVLMGSPEGKAAFHALLARATHAGKVYALSAIYVVEPRRSRSRRGASGV